MAKTCLVCGGRAGSAEHIFPAALGGRRTNRGIYCETHNNGYSPLAARLTEQLEIFNAQLGVKHDRTRKVRPARLRELQSGKELLLTECHTSFAPPEDVATGEHMLSFSSMADAQAWAERQRAKGMQVEFGEVGEPSTYHPGTSLAQIALGGSEGLRAIGYVGQTFLAHAFPRIAREAGLQPFVRSTYDGGGEISVWWDFDSEALGLTSPFEFGHRIIVGVDAESKVAYGRVSLFAAFDFAMIFGPVETSESFARIFDVDPLAENAPADLSEIDTPKPPKVPRHPTDAAALKREIESGGAAAKVASLQRRIQDRERTQAATLLIRQVQKIESLPSPEQAAAFTALIGRERQRIWSMLGTSLSHFEASDAGAKLKAVGLDVAALGEADPSAHDGLSDTARQALDLACEAMAQRFHADFLDGALDQARIRTLIADGEGHALVLRAALTLLMPGLGEGTA